MVSHLHARLERTPDHLVVSDLASSNGTFVNGTLVREPVELVDGDTLYPMVGVGSLAGRARMPAPASSWLHTLKDARIGTPVPSERGLPTSKPWKRPPFR